MHRAWDIPEITAIIAAFLKEYEQDGQNVCRWSLASLASLARTCRTISPVILDELWADPGDMQPVLKLLPDTLWEEAKLTGVYIVSPMPGFTPFIVSHLPSPCESKICRAVRIGHAFSAMRTASSACRYDSDAPVGTRGASALLCTKFLRGRYCSGPLADRCSPNFRPCATWSKHLVTHHTALTSPHFF